MCKREVCHSDQLPEDIAQDATIHVVSDLGLGVKATLHLKLLDLTILSNCGDWDDLADLKLRLV